MRMSNTIQLVGKTGTLKTQVPVGFTQVEMMIIVSFLVGVQVLVAVLDSVQVFRF